MTILHLSKGYHDFGGIESVVNNWKKALDTLPDFSCTVLAMDKKNVGRKEDHVKSYRPWMFGSQPISMGYFLHGLQLARRHDIVHVHLPNYLSCLMLLFLRRDKKVILHWHSDVLDKRLASVLRPLEKWVLRRATKVLFTSKNYLESSYAKPYVKRKAVIVPLCTSEFPLTTDPRAKHTGKMLFLGRFVNYKGFNELIDVIRANAWEDQFVLAGRATPELNQEQVKRLGLTRLDVRFDLDRRELIELLRDAKFLILPSITRAEAFGVVAIEALAAGTPLLTSELEGSGLNDINVEEVTGYKFKPGNLSQMRAAIETAKSLSLEDYELLCNNALSAWRQQYAISKLPSRIKAVYSFDVDSI